MANEMNNKKWSLVFVGREMVNNLPNKSEIGSMIKREELKDITLNCDCPERFTQSQVYLLYRWLVFLHWFIFLSVFFFLTPDMMDYGLKWIHKGFHFIYFTTHAIIVMVVDTGLQAVMVTRSFFRAGRNGYMGKLNKISWVLETINADIALTITTIYWIYLHEYDRGVPGFATVEAHLCNSIYVIFNMFVTDRPVKLLHVIFPLLLGFFYVVFSYAYHLGHGTNPHDWQEYIYPILNWNHPWDCINNICLVFLLIVVTHLLRYILHCLREYIKQKEGDTSFTAMFSLDDEEQPPQLCDDEGLDSVDCQRQDNHSDVIPGDEDSKMAPTSDESQCIEIMEETDLDRNRTGQQQGGSYNPVSSLKKMFL